MPSVLLKANQGFLGAGLGRALRLSKNLMKSATLAILATAATVSAVSAETLLMPKRDARTTAPVVVWGVTTQVQGAALPCSLDFGDATPAYNCTGVDRSYIAQAHTYAVQGTYTVTLTVGAEQATTTVQVFNPAAFPNGGVNSAENRNLGINMAIEDGLRFLWTNQISRAANFPTATVTSWNNSGYPTADTSLVVLAFENHGYKIAANAAPTGVYEKYIVRRGLNYVISTLQQINISVFPVGNNPCTIYADCIGLGLTDFHQNYETAVAVLSIAGSGAMSKVNNEVAGYTNGKTYGEILQRMVNALAWGQIDSSTGKGGWYYNFTTSATSDGSAVGWDILALLDAAAAGATVPTWVNDNFKLALAASLNTDGSYDYQSDGNPAANNSVGPQKNGIGLQGLFLIGETSGARVDSVKNNVNSWWSGAGGIGGNSWGGCTNLNKGCGYTMFNNFKGLKLQGIVTLPGVTRPAGPGAIPAGDWYADYEDWLVANQTAPTTTAGGSWSTMGFSCCASGTALTAAIAELILAPVALVPPDPGLFSTVGLSPATATNPVGTDHTVTAFTQATNGAPVPGVSIDFRVLSGPNAGKTGSGTTGADGKTTFTYHDDGGAGTDTIQAFIGTTLSSNQVTKTWADPTIVCDVNGDGKVTQADLVLIRGKNLQNASGPNDPYDPNKDGKINVADVRYCQLRLTPP